jgi:hypothetical protein
LSVQLARSIKAMVYSKDHEKMSSRLINQKSHPPAIHGYMRK